MYVNMYQHIWCTLIITYWTLFVDEAKAMLDEDEEQFEKENIFREVDFNFSFFAKFWRL